MERSWTDQPARLEQAEVVAGFSLRNLGVLVEVRKDGSELFVTVGNLFGSQTVKVPDAETALRLIDAVAHLKEGEQVSLNRFPGIAVLVVAS